MRSAVLAGVVASALLGSPVHGSDQRQDDEAFKRGIQEWKGTQNRRANTKWPLIESSMREALKTDPRDLEEASAGVLGLEIARISPTSILAKPSLTSKNAASALDFLDTSTSYLKIQTTEIWKILQERTAYCEAQGFLPLLKLREAYSLAETARRLAAAAVRSAQELADKHRDAWNQQFQDRLDAARKDADAVQPAADAGRNSRKKSDYDEATRRGKAAEDKSAALMIDFKIEIDKLSKPPTAGTRTPPVDSSGISSGPSASFGALEGEWREVSKRMQTRIQVARNGLKARGETYQQAQTIGQQIAAADGAFQAETKRSQPP